MTFSEWMPPFFGWGDEPAPPKRRHVNELRRDLSDEPASSAQRELF